MSIISLLSLVCLNTYNSFLSIYFIRIDLAATSGWLLSNSNRIKKMYATIKRNKWIKKHIEILSSVLCPSSTGNHRFATYTKNLSDSHRCRCADVHTQTHTAHIIQLCNKRMNVNSTVAFCARYEPCFVSHFCVLRPKWKIDFVYGTAQYIPSNNRRCAL